MATKEKKQLTLTCEVDQYRSGWTVVDFLAHRFKYHTAESWEVRVRDERVHVNGAAVTPEHVVHKSDAVQYTILHYEPPVDARYDILYEDDHILAVSKSGNIPVHACGVYITHTLIATLKEDFGASLNLGHRLDRETSGVVVLAKHKEANRGLAGRFARGEVAKRYLAVVLGHVKDDTFTVDAPIGKIDIRYQYPDEYAHGKENDLATYLPKRVVDPEGRPARTRFEVARRGALEDGTEYSCLYCYPEEGRTNQIRVHLHHTGHPLVGDKTYALTGDVREEQIRHGITPRVQESLILERHALHCGRLAFAHPVTGAPLEIDAPPPDDLSPFFP